MRFLLVPICLLLFLLCGAQPPATKDASNSPLLLSSITEQNGLSDNHVQCVLKDSRNFVWVGTADGLNLLNGSDIRVFRHIDSDSNSIISNNILSLGEDNSGNIWIATNEGLSRYHPGTRSFTSALPPPSPYGASSVITAIVIDWRGQIWCATDGGLMKYEPALNKFSPFYITSTEQQSNITYSNKLHHLLADSYHRLWLATSDGVWSFDLQTRLFRKEIHKNNDAAYHSLFLYVFEDHEKKIWAGNWQNGLKKIEPGGKVTNYLSSTGNPGTVSCINEIKEPGGRYVLWLNGRLQAFDPSTGNFFKYPSQAASYPDLNPAFKTLDGWIWMTSNNGLYTYSPQRQAFHHHFFDHELTTQGIVFAEWHNELLVGAQGPDLLRSYGRQWQMVNNFSSSISSSNSTAALSLVNKEENNLWMGSTGGIASIDLAAGKTNWFRHKENDSTSLPRDFVTQLFFDSRKQLWVFPWREGIWQMDPVTGNCKRLLRGFIQEGGNIKGLLIASAVEDNAGNIWMADLDEGIILYDRSTAQFSKPFVKELGETSYVSKIFLQDGYCYAVTSSFIMKWSPRDKRLIKFNPPPEINKVLYEMIPDKKGNWWVASKNGLIVFNEQQHSFKRYTTVDGLVSNDITGTLYCRNDGTMLIGSPTYITSFNPDQLVAISANLSPAVLTEILANEKVIEWNGTHTLNFDHKSTNLVFRWALPDHTNSLKNQYYCQLQGIDTGWKYAGNKGEIQYANLSAGDYRLLLKAASSNGTPSGNIITVNFVIHPPFWKTTWFILLASIAFLTVLIVVVRYISRRNLNEKLLRLEKEQAIEKERNRISRDMHDDLGSGLSKIAIMSEVVKKQINDPEKAKQQLENISVSSRELVDNLQDIIWILNPKHDTTESLAVYIREFALKFFDPFGISVLFQYPEKFTPHVLPEETRRNLFLAVKEAFNNISKHAGCSRVSVTINESNGSFELSITDNGKGFDTGQKPFLGNGLSNMKNRITFIGGVYTIVSVPGSGTTININIPL